MWVIEDADVARLLAPRPRDAHKWLSAVAVVAGSPGMTGAAGLCARAAYRAGAGMVRLGIPGGDPADLPVSEAVGAVAAGGGLVPPTRSPCRERCRALVVGPGLGRADATVADVRGLVAAVAGARRGRRRRPLRAGHGRRDRRGVVAGPVAPVRCSPPTTGSSPGWPGAPPGADRIAAAGGVGAALRGRGAAEGPDDRRGRPGRDVLLATAGSPRLATAGTGDVLSGVIGAFMARGVELHHAAALAAHVHGRAAELGSPEGLVAGDLAELIGRWLSGVRR